MSLRAKRAVVAELLGAFALWPLAHRALVHLYDLSAWNFFGWAMYCTPRFNVTVGVVGLKEGGLVRVELPPELRRAQGDLVRRRTAYGRLAGPDGLAGEVLSVIQELDGVVIVTEKKYLDTASATVLARRDYYRFVRTPGGIEGGWFDTRILDKPEPSGTPDGS